MVAHSLDTMTDLAVRLAAQGAKNASDARVAVRSHAEAAPRTQTSPETTDLLVEDVYREQFGFVWRSLRHLGVRNEDVEDAIQDVFVVVHTRLRTFEQRAKLSTWIYGICINVAQARHRRAHVRRELPTDPVEMPAGDARVVPADEAYERREAEAALDSVLDTLPIEQRAVFTLFELDERSCEEIAELCSIPLGTVYSRLRLAREAFRRAAARVGARARFVGGGS